MTNETNQDELAGAGVVADSIAALETRLAELEQVVHALAPVAPAEHHGVILPWLEKVGARIAAVVRKV